MMAEETTLSLTAQQAGALVVSGGCISRVTRTRGPCTETLDPKAGTYTARAGDLFRVVYTNPNGGTPSANFR